MCHFDGLFIGFSHKSHIVNFIKAHNIRVSGEPGNGNKLFFFLDVSFQYFVKNQFRFRFRCQNNKEPRNSHITNLHLH